MRPQKLFIEDKQLVKKTLKHLNLWDVKRKPTPRANARHLKPLSSMMSYHRPAQLIMLSMPIILWKPTFKKSSCGQTGELCPNLPESSIPPPKFDWQQILLSLSGWALVAIEPYQQYTATCLNLSTLSKPFLFDDSGGLRILSVAYVLSGNRYR